MRYCKNHRTQAAEASKSSNQCSAPRNNNEQQLLHLDPNSFNKGKEIAVSYYNHKSAIKYKIIIVCYCILLITGLIMLFFYNNFFDSDTLFPHIIIGIIFLSIGTSLSGIKYQILKNNALHIHENCIFETSAIGFSLKSFEAPYRSVISVRVIAQKRKNIYIQIFIRDNISNNSEIFSCCIENCYEMIKHIQKRMDIQNQRTSAPMSAPKK